MRFRRLIVRDFRAIEEARVELGPGLNVLYGPNDLGKTTLATAIRAALLLPAESTAHQSFVPWHKDERPEVDLYFEHNGSVYRVRKTFGSGAAASAELFSSLDGSNFREEERGRAVDRRVRELLRWGIEAPGSKGAARGLPESFLSQVLLAGQSSVPDILGRTLGEDRDGSGRERLHEALQALARDPIFTRVLDAARAKVDEAFTPTGRRKSGQSSPFAALREQINALARDAERFSQARRESEEVQARLALHGEARVNAEARVAELEHELERERAALERFEARERLRERCAAVERTLLEAQAARAELGALERELGEATAAAERHDAEVQTHAEALAAAEEHAAQAERAFLEQSGPAALDRAAQQRRALEQELGAAQSKCVTARRLLELESAVARASAALREESAAAARAEALAATASDQIARGEAALRRLRRLEAVGHYRAAERELERARAARVEAEALAARALEERQGAEAAPRESRLLAELTPARLAELRELERQLRVTEARLEVGLNATVRLLGEGPVTFAADGGREQTRGGRGEAFLISAKGRIALAVPGALELEAVAGSAETRAELSKLQARWAELAEPLFEATGARDLAALAERCEAERTRARDAEQRLAAALALEARAAEKRELGRELEVWQRRVEERRPPVEPAELEELVLALGARGDDAEAVVRGELAAAERDQARLRAAQDAASATLLRHTTRVGSLSEALEAARADRARSLAELGVGDGKVPSVAELEMRLAAAELEVSDVRARLEAAGASEQAAANAARASLDRARAVLGTARERHAAALAESRSARERRVALESRSTERRRQVDALDLASLEREHARARAELAAAEPSAPTSRERVAELEASLERARAELAQCLAELRRAEGALGHVGGDVARDRERSTLEALTHARELELDLEREYEGYRLLTETLQAVENEQGAHLGRALEGPLSDRFAKLTRGRYAGVGLDSDLGLRGVVVSGQARAYRELSAGTQEQLATILRLCIAEQLETALVLDDHLAQTQGERAAWFRDMLRRSSERIQIVVITARPEDYVTAEELASAQHGNTPALSIVDLERVIQRAAPGPR